MEHSVIKANSAHPDQTPRSVAPDLGLHYLPVPLLWDTRYKWIKATPMMHCFGLDVS